MVHRCGDGGEFLVYRFIHNPFRNLIFDFWTSFVEGGVMGDYPEIGYHGLTMYNTVDI